MSYRIGAPDRPYCPNYPPCVPLQQSGFNEGIVQKYSLVTFAGIAAGSLAQLQYAPVCGSGTFPGTGYYTGPGSYFENMYGDWTGFYYNGSNYATLSPGSCAYAADAGNTYNFQKCAKYGWKNVQAKRYWHGNYGFLGTKNIKYTSLSATGSYEYIFYPDLYDDGTPTAPPITEGPATLGQTVGVISTSGVQTVGSGSGTNVVPPGIGGGAPYAGRERLFGTAPAAEGGGPAPFYGLMPLVNFIMGGGDITSDDFFIQLTVGYYGDGGSFTTYDVTQTNTATTISTVYHKDAASGGVAGETITVTLTLTYSGATAATDIINDAQNLMASWNLNDDVLYPWRTDAVYAQSPLVMRKENQGDVPLIGFQIVNAAYDPDTGAITVQQTSAGNYPGDPKAAWCDGSIIGNPNAGGGAYPEDYFDPYADNQEECEDGSWARTGVGALLSQSRGDGNQMPARTTHWLNLNEMQNKSLGAWVRRLAPIGTVNEGNDAVWVSKWAETKIKVQGMDFARPWGFDRYTTDQTASVGCASGFDGTTMTFYNAVTFATGDTLIYFDGTDGGIYKVATGGSGVLTITVTTVRSTMPPGFVFPASLSGQAVAARLLFPNCAPFAGRLKISSIVDNMDGTCTINHSDSKVLIDDPVTSGATFQVWLCQPGMVSTGTAYTVITSGTTQFKITAALADIKNAIFVVLKGALPADSSVSGVQKWYFSPYADRDNSHGNFVIANWVYDFGYTGPSGVPGSYGYSAFAATDYCAGNVNCSPYRIVLSPNASDAPATGQGVLVNPGNPGALDDTNGTMTIMDVIQAVVDPFYEAFSSSCGTSPISPGVVECMVGYPANFGAAQNETPTAFPSPVCWGVVSPYSYPSGPCVLDPPIPQAEGIQIWEMCDSNGVMPGAT